MNSHHCLSIERIVLTFEPFLIALVLAAQRFKLFGKALVVNGELGALTLIGRLVFKTLVEHAFFIGHFDKFVLAEIYGF